MNNKHINLVKVGVTSACDGLVKVRRNGEENDSNNDDSQYDTTGLTS